MEKLEFRYRMNNPPNIPECNSNSKETQDNNKEDKTHWKTENGFIALAVIRAETDVQRDCGQKKGKMLRIYWPQFYCRFVCVSKMAHIWVANSCSWMRCMRFFISPPYSGWVTAEVLILRKSYCGKNNRLFAGSIYIYIFPECMMKSESNPIGPFKMGHWVEFSSHHESPEDK